MFCAGRDDEALNLLREAGKRRAREYISETLLQIDIMIFILKKIQAKEGKK